MHALWKAGFLIALAVLQPAAAQKQLVVGRGGLPWTEVQDSSAFVNVAADSLWIWPVEPDENLGPGTLGRGGSIYASDIRERQVGPSFSVEERSLLIGVREVEAMVDGDESTAFNPDEAGLEYEVEVYIDLGGTFRINRVRLFPRLDSDHLGFFPQTFEFSLGDRSEPVQFIMGILDQRFSSLIRYAITRPNDRGVVDWPGTRQVTGIREVRYLRFQPLSDVPWEIAELEIYSDGTVPTGEFVSKPLLTSSGTPVWGAVRHEGERELGELPVVLQTRSGPDEEPLHFFIQTGARVRRVNRAVWEAIEDIPGAAERGPVLPNPEWSQWETVADGIIRSPSPRRFIQFRVRLLEAGARLERLVFEYSTPPLARQVEAEIRPKVVDAGRETAFVLSLQMRRMEGRSDTGFRFVEILTPAEIVGIDSVRVDDRAEVYTARRQPGEGVLINLWRRVLQDGAFVQVFFRSKVFIDGTQFRVRVLDRRYTAEAEGSETVYQFAREGDVEPLFLGATLAVRLASADNPLIADVARRAVLFTPNGDGVNDLFAIAYSLLKLTRPAPISFEIFDLSGRLRRQGRAGDDASGRFVRLWDGRDEQGAMVKPGLYVYRLQVEADAGTATRQGVVGVAY